MPSCQRALWIAPLLAVIALAGCAPSGLDAQQARAEARECASLLERHVSGRKPTGKIVVDGVTIDLGADPEAFYRELSAARGPNAFPFSGGKASTSQRASFISDLCRAVDAKSSSSRSATNASTASSTTSAGATRTSG